MNCLYYYCFSQTRGLCGSIITLEAESGPSATIVSLSALPRQYIAVRVKSASQIMTITVQ